jgi:hypothetical protein
MSGQESEASGLTAPVGAHGAHAVLARGAQTGAVNCSGNFL